MIGAGVCAFRQRSDLYEGVYPSIERRFGVHESGGRAAGWGKQRKGVRRRIGSGRRSRGLSWGFVDRAGAEGLRRRCGAMRWRRSYGAAGWKQAPLPRPYRKQRHDKRTLVTPTRSSVLDLSLQEHIGPVVLQAEERHPFQPVAFASFFTAKTISLSAKPALGQTTPCCRFLP